MDKGEKGSGKERGLSIWKENEDYSRWAEGRRLKKGMRVTGVMGEGRGRGLSLCREVEMMVGARRSKIEERGMKVVMNEREVESRDWGRKRKRLKLLVGDGEDREETIGVRVKLMKYHLGTRDKTPP